MGRILHPGIDYGVVAASFVPTDISGMLLWMRADTGTSTTTDGQAVSSWVSKEGNAYDYAQATGDKQPLYRDGANGINGKPAIQFDGVDDFLLLSSAPFTGTAGMFYCVYEVGATGVLQYFFAQSDNATSVHTLGFNQRATNQIGVFQNNNDGASADNVQGSSTVTAGEVRCHMCRNAGSAYALELDGNDETESINSGTNSGDWWDAVTGMDHVSIGALITSVEARQANCKIAELGLYDADPSDEDRGSLESYLNEEYGITFAA